MLKEWEKAEKPDDEELSERLKKARLELAGRQMAIKEKKLPVLVIIAWNIILMAEHHIEARLVASHGVERCHDTHIGDLGLSGMRITVAVH